MDFISLNEARNATPGLTIRTADIGTLDCADRLVARRYADRGYGQISSHTEESLTICSAFDGTATVGTIAVRFESNRVLNADVVFGAELAELRANGVRICEFSRLAMDKNARDNKQVLAHLFHLAYLHAHRLAGCRLLLIEVNPRHVPFYRRMLGFQVRTEPRLNPRVNAPAVLMSLDMEWGREQIAKYSGRPELASQTRTLFPYFYGAEEEAAMLAKLMQ